MAKEQAKYDKLDPLKNEIRLLILAPATDRESAIECALQTVSLDDKPSYEAVSYACGNLVARKSVRFGDRDFDFPHSAWAVLQALRYTHKPRTLWIDAICINQEDLEERASQVTMMGQVYRMATSVRVWLGADSEDDKDATSILQEMREPRGAERTLHDLRASQHRSSQLERFFARQWWERFWVVQEVALGHDVVFQQGSNELTFEDLLDAYHTSSAYFREVLKGYRRGTYSGNDADIMEVFECVRVLDQARALSGTYLNKNSKFDRHDVMTWTTIANLLRCRKATIDSDRLYSLYGLLPAGVAQLSGMQPSYSVTTEHAFTEVTYSIMEASKSLMIFNFLGNQKSAQASSSLPSWVPDWRQLPGNRHESNLRVPRERLFDASKGAPFYLRRLSGNTLCLKGCFVDVVQRWTPKPLLTSASPMLEACYLAWRDVWKDAARVSGFSLQDMSALPLEDSFRTTVLYGCELDPADGSSLRQLTGPEGQAMWAAHERAVRIACGEDDEVYNETLSDNDARRTEYMMNCAKRKTFFATSSLFMGMTQTNLEGGDHIFIVAGNSHPVILRPSKRYANTWRAVGECYLHGFMDGFGLENREVFEEQLAHVSNQEQLKTITGTERNSRWDEIHGDADGPWKWLLLE